MNHIKVGEPIPDFSLLDESGQRVTRDDLLAKSAVVIFFYPKDGTPICTREACAFRDSYSKFTDAGAAVVGISSDTSKAHRSFADKHHLPFPLLADPGGTVRREFGVPKTLGFVPGRVTYVVDKEGIVRHVFNSQFDAERHVNDALEHIQQIA